MTTTSETFPLRGQSITLSPAEIDRELAQMWKPSNEKGGSGSVTRVVLGNLIWIGTRNDRKHAWETLLKVVPRYPCRMFLLEFDPDSTSETIGSAVNAQCFLRPDGGAPVCCEMIDLAFSKATAHHMRGCVAPLLLPDLQTVLWLDSGAENLAEVAPLREHVDRLLYLSSRSGDPAETLARCVHSATPAFDLSWFRLAAIREQVAAFFDDASVSLNLRDIASVELSTGHQDERSLLPQVVAAMFLGWLGSRLEWRALPGFDGRLRVQSPSGPVDLALTRCEERCTFPTLSTIVMTDRQGETFRLSLRAEGNTMEMASEGARRHLFLSELSEQEALGAALNTTSGHRAFLRAAGLATPILRQIQRQAR
jgi:glucose-6-phosphate dehydrogenase assembly protein OpcA